MSRAEVYDCLRNLQVVPTLSTLSEERISELLEKNLIERKGHTKSVWLTSVGIRTKTGEV